MEKFTNPVPDASSESKSGKSIIYKAKPKSDVFAPYEGRAEQLNNGVIRIKHRINGNVYYSVITNVENVTIRSNVYQNEMIGETGKDDIKFDVLDGNYKAVNINDVFKFDNGEKGKTKSKDYSDKSPLTGLDVLKAFATPVTVPISLLKMAGKHVFNKIKGEGLEKTENTINEEVERIKQLMK